MKKYKEFIKESIDFLHNLDDDELKEKRQDIIVERNELDEQIQFISNILRDRESRRAEEISENFPKSIFDLNKEQLDFILEHSHSVNPTRYDISSKYVHQLSGVYPSGFNTETHQFSFNIVTRSCMDDGEDNFVLDEGTVKSIKFLGENLKRMKGGYVHFGILWSYEEEYRAKVHYFSDSHIEYRWENGSGYGMRKMESIEKMLEYIVDSDLVAKDVSTSRGF